MASFLRRIYVQLARQGPDFRCLACQVHANAASGVQPAPKRLYFEQLFVYPKAAVFRPPDGVPMLWGGGRYGCTDGLRALRAAFARGANHRPGYSEEVNSVCWQGKTRPTDDKEAGLI